MLLLMSCMSVTSASAQSEECDDALACNNHINLSLDDNCEALIDPYLVLQGTTSPCISQFDVDLFLDEAMTQPLNVNAANDVVNGEYLGQTIIFSVSYNGNSCWGTLLIEDKINPTIDCSGLDALYSCADLEALLDGSIVTPDPTYDDNCSASLLPYVDAVEEIECEGYVITRTYTVEDGYGNTATCSAELTLENPDLGDVELPGTVILECADGTDTTPAGLALAGFGGDAYPHLNTASGLHLLNPTVCNLGATYEDLPTLDLCGDSYKIIRKWTIIDWCDTDNQLIHNQIIKILDTTAPLLECADDFELPTASPYVCTANVPVPYPGVIEACGDYTLTVETPEGTFNWVDGLSFNAAPGTYDLIYTAEDACGNISESCTTTVTIYDGWGPVAICDQNTVVSLDQLGWAEICAATFDDGSYDACEEVVIKVKRMDASATVGFEDCIQFSCSDLEDGCNGNVLVRMRVYDITGNYSELDSDARYNECMVNVNVQDKLAPIITCPANTTVNCMADYSTITTVSGAQEAGTAPVFLDGALIGYYPVIDNCNNSTIDLSVSENIDNCGEGIVVQTWTVTDACGWSNTCTTTIIVERDDSQYYTGDDDHYDDDDISWPANDLTLDCAAVSANGGLTGTENTGEPILYGTDDDCATLYVGHNDEILYDDPDACYKILRTWKVIDWCQYDPNNGSYDGIWTHLQVIKVNDDEAPEFISDCASIVYAGDDDGDCQEEVILTAEATDNCSDVSYTWTIDADANGTVDFYGTGNDASGVFPIGAHSITFTATDECGNESECSYPFEVYDDKKPTPVCIVSLSTVIMPSSGEITIWANDFDASSFDDCSNPIEFRINAVSIANGDPVYLSSPPAHDYVSFDCNFLGEQLIQLWVVDAAGNYDYCVTSIFIQDSNNTCGVAELADIAGHVFTEEDQEVDDVTIDVVGGSGVSFLTGNDGYYNFSGLPMSNYVVTPEKDMDYLNGVTTYDLVLISQHILNINNLDTPYKMIAADANGSGTVTTFDLITLRRLILNIDVELSNSNSWRFVDESFVFPNANNPWATEFPEVISINNSNMEADFVAVKIGDVNGSASPNKGVQAQTRSAGQMFFNVNDQKVAKNETFTVDFKANDFNEVLGYQFTLAFDNDLLEFVEVVSTSQIEMEEENFGFAYLEDGLISASWNKANAITVGQDEILFSLTFTAKDAINVSDVISLNSRLTKAEAYRSTEQFDVAINFNTENAIAQGGFELYQNNPNPFKGQTTISFNLPEASTATLTVTDISGRVVMSIEGDFAKGYNELLIENQNKLHGGVFYYQLQSGDFHATKKMIIVK